MGQTSIKWGDLTIRCHAKQTELFMHGLALLAEHPETRDALTRVATGNAKTEEALEPGVRKLLEERHMVEWYVGNGGMFRRLTPPGWLLRENGRDMMKVIAALDYAEHRAERIRQ